jgi:ATP-dependent helicase/nuclease subunit A
VPASERRTRLHAIDALLALALDLDGGRHSGLYSFVRALKTRALKLAWPTLPDAVQLLTVHGAKGLEARVVFVMDCEAAPARAETSSLAVAWEVQDAAPRTVAFLASENRPPPSLQLLLDEEREQRRREELNALYVALTRARSRLVFSRTPPARKNGSASGATSWWSRLQPLSQPLVAPAEPPSFVASDEFLLPVLPAAPQPGEAGAEIGRAPELVDESAALGEALHRVLEWASGPRPQALAQLLAAAAQMYGLDAARSERLTRSAQAILDSAACARFFASESLLWAGNEVAVSWRGQDMRIDRLVCLHGEGAADRPVWWVLDYKLNPAPQQQPEYLQQLLRYREAVRELQPGEPVRTAFINGQGRLIDCTEIVEQLAVQSEA